MNVIKKQKVNFSKVDKILEQLEDKRKVLNFIMDGQEIHNLPLTAVRYLTMERISELYNVEPVSCKHKNVSEIRYCISVNGREYEGYCDDCNTTVYGETFSNESTEPSYWRTIQ